MAACFIFDPEMEWEAIETWSSVVLKGKGLWTTLCKLSLGAAVYHIWRQCNDLVHGNTPWTKEQIVAHVRWEVRSKIIHSCCFKDSVKNWRLMQEWNL
jgi:hypothetical protein